MEKVEDDLEYHIDHIKFSYQATIQLLTREGESVWNRFNSILLVNSILLAAITVLITSNTDVDSQTSFNKISLLLIFLGILLCVIWSISLWRGFQQAGHYYHKLIELENKENFNGLNIMSSMDNYREGKEINFDHLNSNRKLNCLVKKLPIKWACLSSMFLFLLLYLLILCFV